MCGRYAFALGPEEVAALAGSVPDPFPKANYNQSPGVPVLALDSQKGWIRPVWGAETLVEGGRKRLVINARSETAAGKPMFADSFRRRRCVLPASGFFEWPRSSEGKQPFFFPGQGGSGILLGALLLKNGDDRRIVVLTRGAGNWMNAIHHRAPVLIRAARLDAWMDPRRTGGEALRDASLADESVALRRHQVSSRVNRVSENDPELIAAVPAQDLAVQGDLFGE